MSSKRLGVFALSSVCLLTACASGGSELPAAPAREDLLLGRLGHWLGTYLTIGGVLDTHGKSGSGLMLVDTVNGAPIEPVDLWIEGIVLPPGERVVLAGYESGRFIGMPHGVAEATGRPLTQAVFQFQRYFIATSIESGAARREN